MTTNLLTVLSGLEIGIIAALAVLVIAFVAADVILVARNKRRREAAPVAAPAEPVIVYMPAPAAEPAQPAAEEPAPLPVIVASPVEDSPAMEELYQRIKLDRSFTAKLVQADDETKQMYSELKNELLSYAGVKDRMSWRRETYRRGRLSLARFGVRGKTLCLYLALQPAEYAESKYKVEDASDRSSCADTPLMYRIKNPLRMRYAKELIAAMMAQNGLERIERETADYTEELAYRTTLKLIEEELIRVPEGVELPTEAPAPVEPVISPVEDSPALEELYQRIKLDRSFTAKLVQSDDETKQMYSELKNELLSYAGVKDRMSWRRETYRRARLTLARFGVRGKTLCLYLALQPAEYAESKYKVEDASDRSSCADTPLMYRIKNPLRMRYAKELIAAMMAQNGLERIERETADYTEELAYRTTLKLIEEELIRVPEGVELPTEAPAPVEPIAAPAEELAPEEPVSAEPEIAAASAVSVLRIPRALPTETDDTELTLRYNRSFRAKLIQSENDVKEWYTDIKNELLSYRNVRARESWKYETFTYKRKLYAKLLFRGKTLCLYLPVNAADYADSKYKLEDVSDVSAFRDTPACYRLRSERRVKYAAELVRQILATLGAERIEREPEDYYPPYCGTLRLIRKGLIKRVVVEAKEWGTREEEDVSAEEAIEEPVEEVVEEPVEETVAEPAVSLAEPVEEVSEEVVEEPAEPVDEVPAEPIEEVAEEPIDEAVEEPIEEVLAEPVEEVSEEPIDQAVEEPAVSLAKPVEEVVEEPVEETVAESVEELDETPVEEVSEEPIDEAVEEPAEEPAEEVPAEPVEEVAEEVVEELAEEPVEEPAEDIPVEPVEESAAEVAEEPVEEPTEELTEEPAEEVPTEPVEEPAEEPAEPVEELTVEPIAETVAEPVEEITPVEALTKKELSDVEHYRQQEEDENGIPVVGVMFRRRGRKVYWFDPDGKEWEKGELAIYKSDPPQEVIVVECAKRAPEKLHLPLKPLCKLRKS